MIKKYSKSIRDICPYTYEGGERETERERERETERDRERLADLIEDIGPMGAEQDFANCRSPKPRENL
jgi:hypothetical protein